MTPSYTRVAAGPVALAIVLLTVVSPASSAARVDEQPAGPAPIGTVSGTVCDARTAQPLRHALVRLGETGLEWLTDTEGRFALGPVPPGTHRLQVWLVGYALLARDVAVEPGVPVHLELCLEEAPPTFTEQVTVVAGPFPTVEAAVPSAQVIGAADLTQLGGVLTDDVFRAVQAMPGVATGDDFSAQFSVRGSPPRSVGIVLDGVFAPMLLHTVQGRDDHSSVSLLNNEVVGEVRLFAGAYPQRVAGVTGAQVAFQTRDGSRQRTSIEAARAWPPRR